MSVKKRVVKQAKLRRLSSQPLERKAFWFSMLTVFMLSAIIIMIGSQDNITGNAAVQTISYKQSGSELHFEVRNVQGFKEVTIHFSGDVKNSMITFEEDQSIPFEGKAYSKVKVSSQDASKFGSLDWLLRVDEQVLLREGIAVSDLKLFVNNQAHELFLSDKQDEYIFYQVTTTELGNYVMGKKDQPIAMPQITSSISKPESEEQVQPISEEPIIEPENIAGQATEESLSQPEEKTFGEKIADLFRRLFG